MKSKDLRLLLSRSSSRKLFIAAAIAAPVPAAIAIGNAFLLGSIIVGIIYHHPDTFRWISVLALLWAFKAIFTSYFENWCTVKTSEFKKELRAEATTALGKNNSFSSSELSNFLIKGVNALDIYLGRYIPQLLSASITPIVIIAAIYFLDSLSAAIAILTLPLIPIFGALIGRYTNDSVSRKWKSLGSLSRYFEDSLQGFVTLRIFGRNRTQSQRIQDMGDKYTNETMGILRISFLSALVLELAATISVALVAVSIGLRLVDGKISFIHGLTVLILAPEVYFPLRNAASLFHASADGSEVLDRLETLFLQTTSSVEQEKLDFSRAQTIAWEGWELNFPGVAKSSIEPSAISRGEALFIVGESGIGKTSFARNLLGINFDCEVVIDDVVLEPKFTAEYQRNLGWIPQHPHLTPGTIREQFRLVAPEITDPEIIELLNELSLSLRDLPYGLDSQLGGSDEKSNQLSGGQIRKIAVARALIRKPFLIVADEPTADLDSQSSEAIMAALRRSVTRGSALICITHDTDIPTLGDRILTIERVIHDYS